uniref:Uncharacterized protein n=1 Tax=Eutreptiella gymnastica TaxID=73025 RepID=A0A7S4G0N6_9EUGL
MVLQLAYVSDRPSLVDVQWSVSRKFLDSIPGNPKPMTQQLHEETLVFMHETKPQEDECTQESHQKLFANMQLRAQIADTPLQVLKLIALLLRPQQSPTTAHLLHLFLYLFLHLFLPPCLQVAVTVSLLQKRPSSVSPVQVQMLWHPWVQATMPPLWLEQGHALRFIDELKKCRRGGGTPRWLNFDELISHSSLRIEQEISRTFEK